MISKKIGTDHRIGENVQQEPVGHAAQEDAVAAKPGRVLAVTGQASFRGMGILVHELDELDELEAVRAHRVVGTGTSARFAGDRLCHGVSFPVTSGPRVGSGVARCRPVTGARLRLIEVSPCVPNPPPSP